VIVIGISASVYPQTRQENIAAGCHDFLAKPVHIDELLEKLRIHLELEWQYKEYDEVVKPLTLSQQGEIIPPSPEQLSKLYQLARMGNVIRLREQLQELTASEPRLAPFEIKISELANQFRLDEIEECIQQYMKKTSP
jgi:CheY-like chemotaxis protein